MYDQVFKPSKLPEKADFHLFRAGVEPKWEDPECTNGGKWTVISSNKDSLETMWLETVCIFIFLGCSVVINVFLMNVSYCFVSFVFKEHVIHMMFYFRAVNGFNWRAI